MGRLRCNWSNALADAPVWAQLDQLAAAGVVTADGRLLRAGECKNADLLWV
jgi:hypothetical protein